MDADLWNRAATIFSDAVELQGEERSLHLDRICGDQPELRTLVNRLLAADLDPGTVFEEGPAVLFAPDAMETPEAIGPYRVTGTLGQGGMGTVLLAERADGRFDRSVAIKMVRGGFDSGETRRRFESEVRILAGLEHPNIARLYDAGLDDGRPYLVMEYVEGERLDRFCDGSRKSVRERLQLFQEVCRAVQFAHQNLVIHKDIKPSNILVDHGGRTKLLDFGIARLTETEEDPELQPTRLALTPEYASPEQLRGSPLTTASDVYSLGVVLYELLTGRRPHQGNAGDLVASAEAAGREPSRPSTVITRSFEAARADGSTETVTPGSVGEARGGVSPDRLRKELNGDLDQVVLKALQPDPSERYPSVDALVEDLERFLAGFPVSARPDTVAYRTSRFVRRHRLSVSAAAVAVVALLTATGVALWQARVASTERDSAEQAFAFLEDLLVSPDPFRGQGVRADSIRMIDFIDYAAERIDEDLTDQPIARARMFSTLGRVYLNLGRLPDAVPVLEEAVEANRTVRDGTPELAEVQLQLGFALDQNGRREEGEQNIRDAMGTLARAGGLGTLETARAQELLGRSLLDSRRLDEAEPLIRATYDTRLRILGDADPMVARAVNLIAALESLRGNAEEALPFMEEAVAIYRRAGLTGNPDFGITLNNLGSAYLQLDRMEDADAAAVEALEVLKATLGPEHMFTGMSTERLAGIRDRRGLPAEADSLYQTALATLEQVAANNINVISPLINYSMFLRQQGRLAEGEAVATRARDRAAAIVGDRHPLYGGALLSLGDITREAGRPGEAARILQAAHGIHEESLGADHPQAQEIAVSLARSWADLGRVQDAEELLAATRIVAAARAEDDRIVELVDEASAAISGGGG